MIRPIIRPIMTKTTAVPIIFVLLSMRGLLKK
jgi:hypothetical protein